MGSEKMSRLDLVKDFIDTLDDPKDLNIEKLSDIFNLVDDQLIEDSEKGLRSLGNIDLDKTFLKGLNNRRSEMEILAFMLKSARKGVNKTGILYQANLSGRQLKNYLSFLTTAGFIKEEAKKKRRTLFTTTSKGNLFLYHWGKILRLFENESEN
jgi:predicted transcriptional regulator